MSLKVDRVSHESGIEVLTVTGSLTLGREAQQFERTVEELVTNGKNRIIIDLTGVPFMDSAGIGILVGCQSKVNTSEGKLRLCGATERVMTVLKLTKVNSILSLDATPADSLKAMHAA